MSLDIVRIRKYFENVQDVHELGGNKWEFRIKDCPVTLKVKVVRTSPADDPRGPYTGIANYGIKSPSQFRAYRSIWPRQTVQEAVEEALRGFLMWYDPKQAQQTKYELWEDW